MSYKITVYLRAGGSETFYYADYRECLGNLIITWYTRAGGIKNKRVFSPNDYFSYETEQMIY